MRLNSAVALRNIETEYDESEHPRDEAGRWARSGNPQWERGKPGRDYPARSAFPMTPTQRAVETKFMHDVMANVHGYTHLYRKRYGNELSADNAKELSPDYRADRTVHSQSTHETARWLVERIFQEELQKHDPNKNMIIFTAGGTGAGKTTALNAAPEVAQLKKEAQLVYDATLRNPEESGKRIEQALKAGKEVLIIFVHRDPVDAFKHGVLTRAKDQGRTLPLDAHAGAHDEVLNSMSQLRDHFKGNPKFSMIVIDNSRGWGNQKLSSLEALPRFKSGSELRRDLDAILEREHAEGKITRKIYDYTKAKHV